jgi:hypothetical protein
MRTQLRLITMLEASQLLYRTRSASYLHVNAPDQLGKLARLRSNDTELIVGLGRPNEHANAPFGLAA